MTIPVKKSILGVLNPIDLIVLVIIIVASIIRIGIYGNPALSIATNDTPGYVKSSQVPLFSSEILTGRRLLTTNLIYKILEPKDGYQILVNGSIDTTRRVFQPGFDRIVMLQLILSIVGWGFLAFIVSKRLTNLLMKVAATVLIMLFAYTPQMADWDSILMSESLTFSLFALQLAILIDFVFIMHSEKVESIISRLLGWGFIFSVWVFLRDSNLFGLISVAIMVIVTLLIHRFRRNKFLYGILIYTMVVFIFGATTASGSTRALVQISNVYRDDFLSNPGSVASLKQIGMPEPSTAKYQEWFPKNAQRTLIKYMLIHPGYPLLKIMRDFSPSFTEIEQPYFKAPEQWLARSILTPIGNALHPQNTTPFLLSLLLLIGMILITRKNINELARPWAWISIWLFLTASLTLIPTILGDTWALNRHALFSTMIYRLCMWIFPIIVIDLALDPSTTSQPIKK